MPIKIVHTTCTIVIYNQLHLGLFNFINKSNLFYWMLFFHPCGNLITEETDSSINVTMMISSMAQITKKSSSSLLEDFNALSMLGLPFHFQGNQISYFRVFHNFNIWYLRACLHFSALETTHLDSCFHQFLDSLDTWVSHVLMAFATCSLELNIES